MHPQHGSTSHALAPDRRCGSHRALMVAAEHVAAGFSCRVIEPAAGRYSTSCFHSHHCGNSPGVLDRRLSPMIQISYSCVGLRLAPMLA
jgi:hypothetical protein